MLLVEAKVKRGASEEWAARLRRNMYAHGELPRVPYFLVGLPDRFFLWGDVPNPTALVGPDYVIDPTPLLGPYFNRAGTSGEIVTEWGLELAMSAWLEKLVTGQTEATGTDDGEWLRESGLLDAIHGGRVATQVFE